MLRVLEVKAMTLTIKFFVGQLLYFIPTLFIVIALLEWSLHIGVSGDI